MNRLEHILTCIAEESNEVGQRACKALRFGINEVQPGQDKDNWERMLQEFHDLFGSLVMYAQDTARDWEDLIPDHGTTAAKRDRIEKFMVLAREGGALE